jgi:hypothetical protein
MSNPEQSSDARPYWQVEPCPPWCGCTHDDSDHPEDRHHFSRWEADVVLTLEEAHVYRRADGDTDVEPFQIEVSLAQGWRENGPRVHMSEQGGKPRELTPVEAERLGRVLLKAVRLAGGAR